MNDDVTAKGPTHLSHQWGALADNPWMQIVSPAAAVVFHKAALRAWLTDGGSAEVFEALCKPTLVKP